MTWKSPRGHQFADPTLATVDALLCSARVRYIYCDDHGDLAFFGHLTHDDYRRHDAVRRLVDNLLTEAGYVLVPERTGHLA